MTICLSLVHGIDKKALWPLSYLIHDYLQQHSSVGTIEICRDEILFKKGFIFTVGRIKYSPYGLVYQDDIIKYMGNGFTDYPQDSLFAFLVNALYRLRPGINVNM